MRFSLILAFVAVGVVFAQSETGYGRAHPNPGAFFASRTILIPHDEKIDRGGEDSAHVCDTIITIADGVGGWAESGVNPGLFSKMLTREIRDIHLLNPSFSTRELTVIAHQKAAKTFEGSATSVTLKVESETLISTTNIGDSGYALYHVVPKEDGGFRIEQYFRSKEQQKAFNFPYQIGSRGDDPRRAGLDKTHEFTNGDVVLVFSDGVSDNLFDQDFLPCVESRLNEEGVISSYGGAANCIARLAYVKGK